ncbi:MAG: Gfo/Idh/MocA family oxidoreductase [Spirochaetales bacterium]|nr:MAG: Gfo/Idh/MocA family oxidoreductase [Spirochaetales bacterium]
MAKYKAGVFGVGDVSKEYIKAVNLNPLSEVAAVVGRDKKKTEDRIASWGLSCEVLATYEELVARKDIGIIINTGPHHMHAQETIAAAKAGKHIICEKPIGMTFAEMVNVRDAVKKAGVKFQNGLALRWNPFIANMKRLCEKEAFGRIFYAEADYFHGLGPWWNGFTWGGQKKSGGPSASLVAGIHAVDLLRYICGEAEEVYANMVFGHRKDFEYAPTYMATVKFKNGAIGKTSCSFEIESPYLMNFLFHGSKGSVSNKRFYSKDLFPGQTGWQEFETVMPDSPSVSHHPFRFLVDDFINAVDTGADTVLNIDETFKTHELCVAIDRSMETGEKVKLPLDV